jgi:EAL domain-containing protein (putative c-di-GMP-specific phosphodiesterase class I)/FixJ family two-component response regulator
MATVIESILVVEDSLVQRAHAVRLCRNAGIAEVYEAGNGVEALEILELMSKRPCVALIDLEMPGMDGVELIEELHKREYAIPVIIVSSREEVLIQSVESMGEALGVEILGAVQKPLNLQSLLAALGPRKRTALAVAPRADRGEVTPERLREAIVNGEITVCYQPKVNVSDGTVSGVEALARWTHPDLGPISPAHFVPMAEREGMIYAMTVSVMSQAMSQTARWNARGIHLSMAVNLSSVLLEVPTLVKVISTIQASNGLSPSQIIIEVTESAVVSRLAALVRLRLRGFGLAIDDYGTGFSSMQQLARIPFTELKIDRSFVHGAHRKKNLKVILKSALDLSRQLGLISVAEGVEHPEDWRLLQELGCGLGQGFLIARPMPGNQIPHWLEERRLNLPEQRRPVALSC